MTGSVGTPDPDFIGKPCAACGELSEGFAAIHRDGFCVGPEVPLCNACGMHEFPSCPELWEMISERLSRPA